MRYDLRCLPSDDAAFSESARRLLESMTDLEDASEVAGQLTVLLQAAYPDVEVRSGEALAELASQMPILYVFRDGPVLSVEPAS